MAVDPYIGEIQLFAFDYAPKGWALCNGQLLPINQNQALFSLLGVAYGGNGTTNFALPDLRGRIPIHFGQSGEGLGTPLGAETVTLTRAQASHDMLVPRQPTSSRPTGGSPAIGGDYAGSVSGTSSIVGGGQPHENRQPFLTLNFCIALSGIYPSRA